jgi:hypothetical protein
MDWITGMGLECGLSLEPDWNWIHHWNGAGMELITETGADPSNRGGIGWITITGLEWDRPLEWG